MRELRLPDPLPANPLPLAASWLEEAVARPLGRNPNAVTLASVSADGRPSARIVLCKGFVTDPGYLVFYTHYGSRKAVELEASRRAAAVFYWDEPGRQIRIEGPVLRSPPAESDAYFASRPWQSRIAAWASEQSRPISSHAALLERLEQTARRFGIPLVGGQLPAHGQPPVEVPRPPFWGGYRLWIEAVELWVEGAARLHERGCWQRALAPHEQGYAASAWQVLRLQP